jgi:hypothetical protein
MDGWMDDGRTSHNDVLNSYTVLSNPLMFFSYFVPTIPITSLEPGRKIRWQTQPVHPARVLTCTTVCRPPNATPHYVMCRDDDCGEGTMQTNHPNC